jgi:3-methyladenine DNA glycosylase AlkD
MTKTEALKELKAMGTAQHRKVYARHGVEEPMFGVSYGNLSTLKKKIKTDHALAEALWDSGNHDARVLATMVADPEQLKATTLDRWVRELDNYVLSDAFSAMAGKSPAGRKKADQWMKAKAEFVAATGWNVCGMAAAHPELPDAYFEERLKAIEGGISKAKNRVRHSMNQALISIGIRNDKLRKRATAAAKRIGKVHVDHGETGCKTPDAVAYIEKTVAYRKKKAASRAP